MTEFFLGSIIPGSEWQGLNIPRAFTGLFCEFSVFTKSLEEVLSIMLVRRVWLNPQGVVMAEEARRVYPRYGNVVLLDFPVVYASDLEPNQVEVTKRYYNTGYKYTEPNWSVKLTALTTSVP